MIERLCKLLYTPTNTHVIRTQQQTCIFAYNYDVAPSFNCDINPLPPRLLECRPEVTGGVQAGQSKGNTNNLHSYNFFYSREAIFILAKFCTPKAHVSVSHTHNVVSLTSHFFSYHTSCIYHPTPSVTLLLPSPCSSCHPAPPITSGGASVLAY